MEGSLIGKRCLLPGNLGPLSPYKRGAKHGYSGTGWIVTITDEDETHVEVKYIGVDGTRILHKSWISILNENEEK
jgi:hypothetical protein